MSTCLGCGRDAAHLSLRIGHPVCARPACHRRLWTALDELAPHPTDGASVLVRHDSPLASVCARLVAELRPDLDTAHSTTHMAVPRPIGEAVALIGGKRVNPITGLKESDDEDAQSAKRQATTSLSLSSASASSLSAAAAAATTSSLTATSSSSAAPAPAPDDSLMDLLGERALVKTIIELGDTKAALVMMRTGRRTRALALEPGGGLEVALAKGTRSECVSVCADAMAARDADLVLACQRAAAAWFDIFVVHDAVVMRLLDEYGQSEPRFDVRTDDRALLYWLYVADGGPHLHPELDFINSSMAYSLRSHFGLEHLFIQDYLRMARVARLSNGALPTLPLFDSTWTRQLCTIDPLSTVVYHTDRCTLLKLLIDIYDSDMSTDSFKRIAKSVLSVLTDSGLGFHIRYLCPSASYHINTAVDRIRAVKAVTRELTFDRIDAEMARWLAEKILPERDGDALPRDPDTVVLYEMVWRNASGRVMIGQGTGSYALLSRIEFDMPYAEPLADKLAYNEWNRLQPMRAKHPLHADVVMNVKLRKLIGDRALSFRLFRSPSLLRNVPVDYIAASAQDEVVMVTRTYSSFNDIRFGRSGVLGEPGNGLALFENGGAALATYVAEFLSLGVVSSLFAVESFRNVYLLNVADAARFLLRCIHMIGWCYHSRHELQPGKSAPPQRVMPFFSDMQSLLSVLLTRMPAGAATDPAWAVITSTIAAMQLHLTALSVPFLTSRKTEISVDELAQIEQHWLPDFAPKLIATARYTPLQHLTRGQQIDMLIAQLADEAAALEQHLGLPPSDIPHKVAADAGRTSH